MTFLDYLNAELGSIRSRGLHRTLRTLESPHRVRAVVDGRPCVLFNSNDYLGMAGHPRVVEAAARALAAWGFGAPSSRMIAGTTRIHRELEARLAAFKREGDAVLFPAGYLANLGTLTSLAGPGDLVLSDALNHASLVDACRLCRAEVKVYPHLDAEAAGRALEGRRPGRRAFVVTESVFSMDGDVAPLPELRRAADAAGAWLVVDEAHATGVLGATGRGLREHFGWKEPVEVTIGTLGKALGGQGGFAAGPEALADLLRNRARSFLYTTAPLPALCGGVLEALTLLEEEPGRVASLGRKAALLREALREAGVSAPGGTTPIVPLRIGPADKAVEAARALFERGFFVTAIRPPTVPEGTSRLRVSVSEAHEEGEIRAFAAAAGEVLRGLGAWGVNGRVRQTP
jgi:glycine C-acetyltransferase/8-amino-7-oxononanoate synthase